MTHHVLLNNVAHKDLRAVTRHSAEFGDDVHAVIVFPTEYADIQREYPIFFRKDPASGEFQSVALLGLEEGENLFLDNDRWNARYVPGILARGPFLIGFQEQTIDGETRKEPVIHVDMDDRRINGTEGEPLFLEHGGNTAYLQRIAEILRGIQEGIPIGQAMFRAFESHELLAPVDIEAKVFDDVEYVLRGYYTLDEDRLARLKGAALESLNKTGFLQGAFLAVASRGNVGKLIEMKRQRLSARQERRPRVVP